METNKLKALVNEALEDLKAVDVVNLNVRDLSNVTDYMVIASGTSRRHVASLAENVITRVKQAGLMPLGSEGQEQSEWVLVDLGDVVVNIMMPDTRLFYDLEKLWSAPSDETTEGEEG